MVYFEPFKEDEFKQYWNYSVNSWKKDMVRAGLIDERVTFKEAEEQIKRFVPNGLKTPNHYFMHIVSEGQKIGNLWLEIRKRGATEAYLWDILINEDQRGKGYGKSTMAKIHQFAKEKGAAKISLNVFAYNGVARNLYETLGYHEAAITMIKFL